MGMSTHVVGFKPVDEKWIKFKAIWDSCLESNVVVPTEVKEYFDDEHPGDSPGMEVDIFESYKEYTEDMIEGYEIDLSKLPDGVQFIRVYNSY